MALRVALSGFLALVVAMGIGRFAFTPQVPLMIAEHQFTLTSAGLVAAFNYLGYLFGAFDAMRASRHVERRLWLGLWVPHCLHYYRRWWLGHGGTGWYVLLSAGPVAGRWY